MNFTTRSFSCCLVTLVLGASTLASASEWPQFRGPGGQGASDAKNLPTKWSSDENVAWKLALPGPGASSPIVLKDRLYLTCYSGYTTYPKNSGDLEKLTLHVTCIDKSGKLIWDTKMPSAQPESDRVRDHGYAAPTPATDGKHLYVFFGRSGVFKFSLDGKKIWQSSVGTGTHGWGCGTSPLLHENLVIVNASVESGSLVALSKETGKEVWRNGGMKRSWNTPHLVRLESGRTEVVVSVKDKILAYDPTSGKEL
ncbi:MAG: PQQ-binding-like beta-propeller repeat protein, partial [Planctomycetota bacterium]